MRILISDDWRDGYLDEHRGVEDIRVSVRALGTVGRLDDLYFVRERSLRTLWNYAREVGVVWVARKVLSRARESSRNRKFVSVGLGIVDEAGPGARLRAGDAVVFVAPSHPRAFERVVLPPALVRPVDGPLPGSLREDAIAFRDSCAGLEEVVAVFGGWAPASGQALDPARAQSAFDRIAAMLAREDWLDVRRLPVSKDSVPRERDGSVASGPGPTAVLFGYGNYGRTVVLNNVRGALRLAAIHEIDPTLLPPGRDPGLRWDTAPFPREDERFDVHLIASYHHTHVPLAVEALRRGAVAVVEKPIATSRSQLDELLTTLESTGGRFYAGFHKRYAPWNAMARRDLGTGRGDPVHYHAIVFEEPLPARHWYRWPNSCSRLVSNGCHWLDHFLFLNDWVEPVAFEVCRADTRGGHVNVSVSLANGAFLSLLLTDVGSARTGVREHVELRAGGVTVTIDDGARYVAEDRRRILRRSRVNKMASYETMYRTIARWIASGEPGDSLQSIKVSTRLVLDLEEALRATAPLARGT